MAREIVHVLTMQFGTPRFINNWIFNGVDDWNFNELIASSGLAAVLLGTVAVTRTIVRTPQGGGRRA